MATATRTVENAGTIIRKIVWITHQRKEKVMNLKGALKTFTAFTGKHATTILDVCATVSAIGAVVLSAKGHEKALITMENERICREDNNMEPATSKDQFLLTWKYYIPGILLTGSTIGCIWGAHVIDAKRLVALTASHDMAVLALNDYKRHVVEQIGEKKALKVHDAAVGERALEGSKQAPVIVTGKGDYLIYDDISGRTFKSDYETIRHAVNDLNERLMSEMWISLNEFYYELGLPRISIGDDLGWAPETTGAIDINYTSILNDNMEPIMALNYIVQPRYDYGKEY